jgi:hypothetical protein
MNHLSAFIAIMCAEYDVDHKRTAKSDEIVLLPTIFPADDCIVQIKKRETLAH